MSLIGVLDMYFPIIKSDFYYGCKDLTHKVIAYLR